MGRLDRRVRILGWAHVVFGGAGLMAGTIVCAGLWRSADSDSGTALVYVAPLFLVAAIGVLIPGLVGGIALLRQRPWARLVIIVVSVLLLFEFPIGTLLGGFGLWVLLSQRWANGQQIAR